ncbi:MAG: hypothetical protein ABWY25_11775 [Paenisporosarcina sp.]
MLPEELQKAAWLRMQADPWAAIQARQPRPEDPELSDPGIIRYGAGNKTDIDLNNPLPPVTPSSYPTPSQQQASVPPPAQVQAMAQQRVPIISNKAAGRP